MRKAGAHGRRFATPIADSGIEVNVEADKEEKELGEVQAEAE